MLVHTNMPYTCKSSHWHFPKVVDKSVDNCANPAYSIQKSTLWKISGYGFDRL